MVWRTSKVWYSYALPKFVLYVWRLFGTNASPRANWASISVVNGGNEGGPYFGVVVVWSLSACKSMVAVES